MVVNKIVNKQNNLTKLN